MLNESSVFTTSLSREASSRISEGRSKELCSLRAHRGPRATESTQAQAPPESESRWRVPSAPRRGLMLPRRQAGLGAVRSVRAVARGVVRVNTRVVAAGLERGSILGLDDPVFPLAGAYGSSESRGPNAAESGIREGPYAATRVGGRRSASLVEDVYTSSVSGSRRLPVQKDASRHRPADTLARVRQTMTLTPS